MRAHEHAAEQAKLAKWNIPLCESTIRSQANLQNVRIYYSVSARRPPCLISRKNITNFHDLFFFAICRNQMVVEQQRKKISYVQIDWIRCVIGDFPFSIECDSSKRILRNANIVANRRLAQRVTFKPQHKTDMRKLCIGNFSFFFFLLRKKTYFLTEIIWCKYTPILCVGLIVRM